MSALAPETVTPATATRRCDAIDAATRTRCGNPAAGHYMKVCKHEHLEPRWLCAGHVLSAGTALCGACVDHPALSHKCRVVLVPIDSGVTA